MDQLADIVTLGTTRILLRVRRGTVVVESESSDEEEGVVDHVFIFLIGDFESKKRVFNEDEIYYVWFSTYTRFIIPP